MSNSLRPHELQHARPPCPSPIPGVHSNSYPLSQWCHPAISSCPQSLPESESFWMSQLFAWDGQSIGVSALASVLPKNTQNWSPLEWTGWISLQSKGLSRVFSSTIVQKHQFFSALLSSQFNSHPYITAGKTIALTRWTFTHGHHQMPNTEIKLITFFVAEDEEAVYSQQTLSLELTVAQIISFLLKNSGLN